MRERERVVEGDLAGRLVIGKKEDKEAKWWKGKRKMNLKKIRNDTRQIITLMAFLSFKIYSVDSF